MAPSDLLSGKSEQILEDYIWERVEKETEKKGGSGEAAGVGKDGKGAGQTGRVER